MLNLFQHPAWRPRRGVEDWTLNQVQGDGRPARRGQTTTLYRTRVQRRDSQMKKTQPVTRSDPSGLSWSVDL